jgi:hypothetical protein
MKNRLFILMACLLAQTAYSAERAHLALDIDPIIGYRSQLEKTKEERSQRLYELGLDTAEDQSFLRERVDIDTLRKEYQQHGRRALYPALAGNLLNGDEKALFIAHECYSYDDTGAFTKLLLEQGAHPYSSIAGSLVHHAIAGSRQIGTTSTADPFRKRPVYNDDVTVSTVAALLAAGAPVEKEDIKYAQEKHLIKTAYCLEQGNWSPFTQLKYHAYNALRNPRSLLF